MDKEISAINDIRVFINNLKDELNLKNHENSKIKENRPQGTKNVSILNNHFLDTVIKNKRKSIPRGEKRFNTKPPFPRYCHQQ